MSARIANHLLSPRAAWELIGGALLPPSIGWLDTLGRDPNFAAAVNGWIELEARAAWARERQLRMLTRVAGRMTKSELRERLEREERRRIRATMLEPSSSQTGRAKRGRTPRVFWWEGGDGPFLLLLNGWTASGVVWPTQWLERLEQRFRVIRIDNRGTGLSRTAPAPFTMANLADDAADVLSAIGAQRTTVLGVSLGGMIAQELTLRHPGLIECLILVATRPPSPAHLSGREEVMLAALARPDRDQPLEDFYGEMWARYGAHGFAEREPELVDELVDQLVERTTPRVMVLNQLRAIAGWYGSRRLDSIEAPTIVVHGDADPVSPVGNGVRLAQLIPEARYVELSGIGHLLPLEAGEALAEAIP
jgi:pimeloyl-ACP methyl ester carboxylesterase